ncbi:npc1 (niemann-pick type [Lynx pardinus]|uniref:Npc1 (niemann-pick type) n=1 Tax=Lynx pardinus TaxID=191816 RepID=A0A485MNA9_LYNPA|nr:npc1 (niemann-pick type [Lynx pardinus]
MGTGPGKVLPSPPSAPLTFKDGTALALSCMADYGGPVFPFLAVGGYREMSFDEQKFSILTAPGWPSRSVQLLISGLRPVSPAASVEETPLPHRMVLAPLSESMLPYTQGFTSGLSSVPSVCVSVFMPAPHCLDYYAFVVSFEIRKSRGHRHLPIYLCLNFFLRYGMAVSMRVFHTLGMGHTLILCVSYQKLSDRQSERKSAMYRVWGPYVPHWTPQAVYKLPLGHLHVLGAEGVDTKHSSPSRPFPGSCEPSTAPRAANPIRQVVQLCLGWGRGWTPGFSYSVFSSRAQRFWEKGTGHAVCTDLCEHELDRAPGCAADLREHQLECAPGDSYLLDYFLFLNRYFEVGAPVYFVTTGGYNFSTEAGMNAICSSAGCDSFSLTQKIQFATEFPDESYLAIPASSWVDDFIDWLTPSSCCRLYAFGANKDKFCPSTVNSLACLKSCVNFTLGPVRPSVDQFHKYLPWFLEDPPNIKCPKGGLAAYSTSVDLGPGNQVLASRFMAYHKPLRNSQDYTEALRAARALAANITAHLRQVPGTDPAFEVFPYTGPSPTPAPSPAQHVASLILGLWGCSSAGPDVNVALVLEQKMEEAARARVASCPTHQAPTSTASSTYINHGFEHPAKSMGGAVGSLSRGGQEF